MKYFKKGNFIIVKDASDQEKNSFNLSTINRVEIDDLQKKIKFGDGELNFSNFISFTLEDGTNKLKADFPNFSDLKTWALANFFFVAKSNGGDSGGSTNWGSIGGTLSSQTDLQTALNLKANSSDVYTKTQADNFLNSKENTITAGNTSQYYRGDKTFQTLNKAAVGLSNVDNTSDLLKPISTATQEALNPKEDKGNKNVANGYAGLDSNTLLSIPQIAPSRFLVAGANITLTEDPTTKIVTIDSSGGGGGGGGGSISSTDAFIFRERISGVNWTINAGSNTFFNFTDEFATQGVVDQDTNFLTGVNPYFIYDSTAQALKMRTNIVNEHIEFLISCRVSYNGGSGSEFAFVLARPTVSSNTSTGIIETSIRTQGQNVQSTQTRSNGLNINTRLLRTSAGTDPFQTEGFKLGFFNYSTSTAITITDATLTIVMLNRIKF